MKQAPILRTRRIAVHTILGAQTLIAILPVLLVIMNSFKDRKAIFARTKNHGFAPPRLVPIPSADYKTRARRPANSELDCSTTVATFAVARPSWRDSVPAVIDAILAERRATISQSEKG